MVLDTPPVGPVVDAVIVANLADKTIFVVQWASTPRELVETSIQRVSTHKRVAGVVLNFVNQNRAKKYGGEYYYAKQLRKILFRMTTYSPRYLILTAQPVHVHQGSSG